MKVASLPTHPVSKYGDLYLSCTWMKNEDEKKMYVQNHKSVDQQKSPKYELYIHVLS